MTKQTDTKATTTSTKKAPQACACGCKLTVSPGRTWLPGHDARAAGVAARASLAGDDTLIDALPGEKLQAKAQALAIKWREAAEAKLARKLERDMAKANA